MKLLVVSQYFWPENFRINDLVAELVRRGHDVTVLTGLPNYPGGQIFGEFKANAQAFSHYEGADVVRVPLFPRGLGGIRLMLNYASFTTLASTLGPWKLRGREFDAIFVFEPSPITIGIPAIVLKYLKRAPIAFWVLDLWPESLKAVGAVKSDFVLRLVDRLVRFVYRHSDRVLAQSRSFITAITRQIDDPKRIVYFPSWAEPAPSIELVTPAQEVQQRSDLFNIVFTGNIGEAQDFGAVLDAAEILRNEPVRWIIVGDGRKSPWLADEVSRRNLEESVLLPGRFPLERMPSFFQHADALLVSLRDEPIFAMTIPGKLQTYLSVGKPILAMMNGEGADVVTSNKAGFAVAAGDSHALADAVHNLRQLPLHERTAMGRNALACIELDYNRDKLITQLEQLLQQLATKKL